VLGDRPPAHTDEHLATDVAVAVQVLKCMPELGRSTYVRIV